MEKTDALVSVIEKQKEELKAKDEYIKKLEEQLDMKVFYKNERFHAENFAQAIKEAEEIKKQYQSAYDEIMLLKGQYYSLVSELIDEL